VSKAPSKLEANRQEGKHQVEEQRTNILDAAEQLFLQRGLAHTNMVDIAAQASIAKVTLYRYFPNRDAIALEIQTHTMNRIASLVDLGDQEISLESVKALARVMIRNYRLLRDAYRYMGMFDQLYLDHPPDVPLTQWTKDQLISFHWSGETLEGIAHKYPQGDRFVMIMSTVIWFLEKLALRGELTWSDQAVPLEEHLSSFEEMIVGYIERLIGEDG
jgi:AcrR family transcriptional regulator